MKYVLTPAALVILVLSLVPHASAEDSACATTFPERLAQAKADARQWLNEYEAYRTYLRSPQGKAMTFYAMHCRPLSRLEIAIRKLDDPMSFVCDPAAGKKPKELTTKLLVSELSAKPPEPPSIPATDQASAMLNGDCRNEDPIDLTVVNEHDDNTPDDERSHKNYLIFCFDETRKECLQLTEIAHKALALIAQLKAEGKR